MAREQSDRRGWALAVALVAAGCGEPKGGAVDGEAAGLDDATARVASALSTIPTEVVLARQLAPLSGSFTGSARPVLSWAGPQAAAIQICADHACRRTLTAFIATGHRGQPTASLPVGVAYWRLITLGPGFTLNLSPTWELFVPAGNGANPNATRGAQYDANADGYADAAIRDFNRNNEPTSDFLHVYNGGPDGLSEARHTTLPLDPIDYRGLALAAAGDVNGDGYGDLSLTDGGGIVLLAGSAAGLVATPLSVTPPPVSDPEWNFAWSLTPLGDVNGDGYGDLAAADGFRRKVWVFHGGPSGFGAVADWIIDRSAYHDSYVSPLTAGDLDGDGYGDLVVSDYANNGLQGFRYFRGGAAGLEAPTAGTFVSHSYVQGAASGDVNGDGTVDLVASEDTTVELFRGGPGFPGVAEQAISGAAYMGPVELADFDGDGDADLVVHTGTQTSIIYFTDDRIDFYPASPSGLATTATLTIRETDLLPNNELNFASRLSSADFNRDGRVDLLAGGAAPTPAPVSITNASVFVFPGTTTGIAATPAPRLDGPLGFGANVSAGIP